jgi:hypothetical protein
MHYVYFLLLIGSVKELTVSYQSLVMSVVHVFIYHQHFYLFGTCMTFEPGRYDWRREFCLLAASKPYAGLTQYSEKVSSHGGYCKYVLSLSLDILLSKSY